MSKLQTGHIGLNVTDLNRSKAFYQNIFGFQAVAESNEGERRFVFLSDGERLVLTLWQQSQGSFETTQPGLHHLSFEVEDMEKVQAYEQKLRDLDVALFHDGIVPHREGVASGGIFFADPDGIRLEIYSPTGAEDHSAPVADAPTCGFF